jgi:crotonobetainyl-CoA:carnitine CoA-transferase CaiB-like acyl-CoA transferase
MAARGIVSEIPHAETGSVPNIAPPFRFSRTPTVDPVVAPALGQHTNEVLVELLAYDDARLAALAEAGAFGDAHDPQGK